MPSPADPELDTETADAHTGNVAAQIALVATPAVLAILTGAMALMMSVDLNPADRGYPRVLGALLIGVGLWNLVADLRERDANAKPDPEYGRLIVGRVVGFVAVVAVCIWLVEPIGFYPAAGLMMISGMWIMGVRKPLILIGFPAVVLVLGYVLFSVLIGLPLPLAKGF